MVAADFSPDMLPLVVAHRGASATFPENTLESFSEAVDTGVQAVEFDVRLSADEVPVVIHDPDVSRSTDGTGFVHELTLAELKRLDAGGRADRGRRGVPRGGPCRRDPGRDLGGGPGGAHGRALRDGGGRGGDERSGARDEGPGVGPCLNRGGGRMTPAGRGPGPSID